MTDERKEAEPDATTTDRGLVFVCTELLQLTSACAIGASIVIAISGRQDLTGAQWLLTVIAWICFLAPFAMPIERTPAAVTVNRQRIATLRAVKTPDDILLAMNALNGFRGDEASFEARFYSVVGVKRGGEQIDHVKPYLLNIKKTDDSTRREPPPPPSPA
jgi:hypothetical protein